MTNNEPVRNVVLNADPSAVGLPAKLAASETSAVFSVSCKALQEADLANLPPIEGEEQHIHMSIKNRTDAEQREACHRRLTTMCISDLAKGIRASMEKAAAHIDFSRTNMETLARPTEKEVLVAANAKLLEFTAEAQKLRYPALLAKVQAGLTSELDWVPELISFQRLRNCLEHRGGKVGERDLDDNGVLSLQLPYMEVGLTRDDGELDPLPVGKRLERDRVVGTRVRVRQQSFSAGEAIVFPPHRVREIAFSVWLFADDLVSKLIANSDED